MTPLFRIPATTLPKHTNTLLPTTSLLLRHLHQPPPLPISPLHRLRKLIQHLQRRHTHARLLPLAQRLPQQILKLDEIALFHKSALPNTSINRKTYLIQILLHTRLKITRQWIHFDHSLHNPLVQLHSARYSCSLDNLAHGRFDQPLERAVRESNAPCVQACDRADGVQTCVVHEFSPAVMKHIGGIRALRFAAGGVDGDEGLGEGGRGGSGDGGVGKGADEEAVGLVVDDLAGGGLGAANEGDTGEDRCGGVRG
jgi:hypothetical protein